MSKRSRRVKKAWRATKSEGQSLKSWAVQAEALQVGVTFNQSQEVKLWLKEKR